MAVLVVLVQSTARHSLIVPALASRMAAIAKSYVEIEMQAWVVPVQKKVTEHDATCDFEAVGRY